MGFDMFLEILRSLERLSAKLTPMRLQRHVDPDVRCNVVSLDDLDVAVAPRTLEVQIVGALATDMGVADMFLREVED